MDLLFFDTETTGLGECRLVELAYAYSPAEAGLVGDPEVVSFRVKPIIPIEDETVRIHGITNEMVEHEQYFSERSDYPMLVEIFPQCLAVAHNLPFDRGVLSREGIGIGQGIDTRLIAKKIWPDCPDYRLQTLREYLKITVPGEAHTAEGDVLVLIELFRREQNELRRIWGDTPQEALTRMARY